ncbi:MAG TPA: glycosyltransferase [Edaphocola sp.]|nr:glycosyltransferase [Edaphocola sp.]
MKILFAANRFPYPPYRGDKLKIYNLAKRLCKDHELHLLTFLEEESDLQYLENLDGIFKHIHLVRLGKITSYINVLKGFVGSEPLQSAYFRSSKMFRKVNTLLKEENYDAVHIQHLRMAQYFIEHKEIPRILDLPDAFSLYWMRRTDASSGLRKWFNYKEYKRIKAYEPKLKAFDKVLVCSREDLAWLETQSNLNNVSLLPNGVDAEFFENPTPDYYTNRNKILFTGNMDYAPNIDGVLYFCKEIFPLILEKHPKAQFIIAGQRPVKEILALQSEKVIVTGFVPSLKDWYKEASIVVSPLRFGAGTQNKVLEAMAMGVPIISTNIGFEGLNIFSGEGVIVAMDTVPFAQACIRLLSDAKMRKEVGQVGVGVIRSQFDWNIISNFLIGYCVEVNRMKKQQP